jgi:hypothetical protein
MNDQLLPDNLVNSLIRHKDGTVKRVIRDDGENGLFIAPPNEPVMMKPISRQEFRDEWSLHQTVEAQLSEEEKRPDKDDSFRNGNEKPNVVVQGVNLTDQRTLPTVDSRFGVDETMPQRSTGELPADPFGDRAEPTSRDVPDISKPLTDATFSNEPVGGNEESVDALEPERVDPDATDDGPLPAKTATAPEPDAPKARKAKSK